MTRRCGACGAEVAEGVLRCRSCGAPFVGSRRARRVVAQVRPLAADAAELELDDEGLAEGGVGVAFEVYDEE